MKTNITQFEMLVSYMEQNGDIKKPVKAPSGRSINYKKWEDLTNLLNSDPTGESKVTEKWKKVWSDLKNNTKKKAARINKAASGTGGGPALRAKITALEERVLSIMGSQAATGFTDVVEAGFSEDLVEVPDRTATLTPTPPSHIDSPIIITMADHEIWDIPGPSSSHPQEHNPPVSTPVPPQAESPTVPHLRQEVCLTPVPGLERPAPIAGLTPQRRRGLFTRRTTGSPSRPRRAQSQVDRVSEHFLQCDAHWRRIYMKQHEDNCRLREKELQMQQNWLDTSKLAVDAFQKLVNKLCNE